MKRINNKGQTLGVSIIIAIMIFMIGMLAVNFLMPEVDRARSDNVCSSSSISDGTKLLCLVVDWVIPYWFIVILSIAGGVITERFMR